MAVTITSSLRIGLIAGTGVTFDAPVVPIVTTDDIYNPDNPEQTLTDMLTDVVIGPLTIGVIPKAISEAEIGDSLVSEDGTTIAIDGVLSLAAVAFTDLPTGVAGMFAYVTDSTTNTWGATVAGGGANKVLAFFNNANWTVAGK